jgi:hypothetical protein
MTDRYDDMIDAELAIVDPELPAIKEKKAMKVVLSKAHMPYVDEFEIRAMERFMADKHGSTLTFTDISEVTVTIGKATITITENGEDAQCEQYGIVERGWQEVESVDRAAARSEGRET